MGTLTRGELGSRLQAIRGAIWQEALAGDGYADLLRGFGPAPCPVPRPDAATPVHRSSLGAWLVREPEPARTVLTESRFGFLRTDGHKAHLQIMPLTGARLTVESSVWQRFHDAGEPLFGAAAVERQRAPATARATELFGAVDTRHGFDLVTDFAATFVPALLADVLGLDDEQRAGLAEHAPGLARVPDAMFTPQPLPTALAVTKAVKAAATVLAGPASGEDELGSRIAAGILYLAVAPSLIANSVAAWLADPSPPAAAVAAASRSHPPVRLLARVAQDDTELGGQPIRADDQVVVLVADGAGIEVLGDDPGYRLAGPLARLAAEVTLTAVTDRFPTLAAAGEPLRRRRSPVTDAVARLPVAAR